jgi:hypothetical protein
VQTIGSSAVEQASLVLVRHPIIDQPLCDLADGPEYRLTLREANQARNDFARSSLMT